MILNVKSVIKITDQPLIKHTLKDSVITDRFGKLIQKDYSESFPDISDIILRSFEFDTIKTLMH